MMRNDNAEMYRLRKSQGNLDYNERDEKMNSFLYKIANGDKDRIVKQGETLKSHNSSNIIQYKVEF